MAVLTRNKSMVYGLVSDLLALETADTTEKARAEAAEEALQDNIDAEVTSRTTADTTEKNAREAADTTLTNNLAQEVTDRTNADTALQANIDSEATSRTDADDALSGRLDIVEGADTVVGSIAKAESDAKEYADSIVDALADGRVTDLETLTDIIDGDSSVEGSFRKAIADVVGAAPEALDTLKEIADSLSNDAALDSTLRTLISTNITTAKNEIKGEVSDAFDTLAEVEVKLGEIDTAVTTALSDSNDYTDAEIATLSNAVSDAADAENVLRVAAESTLQSNIDAEVTAREADTALSLRKASNLSDLADNAASRTNLDVYSKSESDEAVRLGGAIFITEMITVASDKIVLTHAPKNGMLFNFGTVRHTDALFVSYDIPATVTATVGGKEFQLSPNSAGEFDSKSIMVQYAYIPVA